MDPLLKLYDQFLERSIKKAVDTKNNIRRLLYLVDTPKFKAIWGRSDDVARSIVLSHIWYGDVKAITDWIKNNADLEYGEMSIRQLQRIAKETGILYSTTKSKAELVRLLEDEKNDA